MHTTKNHSSAFDRNNSRHWWKVALVLLVVSAMVFLASCSCAGSSDEKIEDVRNLSFKEKELTVTLGTNKSTGYEWDYKIEGTSVKASINRSFKVTGHQGDAIGETSIGFEGTGEGGATIEFATPVGWDGTGPGDVYTVEVEVGPGGEIISAEGTEGAKDAKGKLAIADIAEGAYAGELSGDKYTNEYDEGTAYSITRDIPPAPMTVTIKGGQMEIYCAASTVASGSVLGVEASDTLTFTHTVSGALPLVQTDDVTVTAEGDVADAGEMPYICWDGNKKFTHWETEKSEGSYHCTVTIALEGGVPTAQVVVDGAASHRTATIALKLVS